MRKLLLLLVGAIVAFSAHAQLYVVGNAVAGDFTSKLQQKYDASNALEASQNGDYYCFRASGEFQLSTMRTGWDNGWKTNSVGITGWQASGDIMTSTCDRPGKETKLNPPSGWGETYFMVKTDLTEIQASKDGNFNSSVAVYSYAIKGNFGDLASSWSSLPEFDKTTLISTYDFGQDGKKGGSFGIQQLQNGNQVGWFFAASGTDNNYYSADSGKTFTLVKENNGNGSNLTLGDDKLYGVVTFKLTLDDNGIPTALTITGGAKEVVDVYTFALFNGNDKLYDFTGSNPYEVKYTISAPLSEGMPLCVKRIKNGNVENTYGLANAATYDGTKLDNAALQQDGEALVLAATLEGAVTFTLNVTDNVPASLTVSGGQLHQANFKEFWLIGKFNGWSQKNDDYKFETTDGKVYTYTVVNEIKSNPGGDGDSGWKINEGTWDNGYEVFGKVAGTSIEYNTVFNLTTDRTAANLEKDIPVGAKLILTYNPGGTSTLLIDTNGGGSDIPVNKPTTLYIQMKYDYATQAADAPKTEDDPIPNPVRCHVYNSVTGEAKSDFNSDEEIMTRESFRYSLWKFELTEEDVEKFDAVDFYIYTKKNDDGTYSNPIEYRSNIAVYTDENGEHKADVKWYDKENWTQFIYATATLSDHSPNDSNPSRYACQSMMSFEDFNALNERDEANGGRSALYLVGWGVTFDAEDAEGNLLESGKSLPGTPAEAYPLPADNGCFYFPVYRAYNDDTKFKVSFVNVASASEYMSRFGVTAKTLADSYDEASQGCPRHWATFDLGLVGVDTRFDYTKFPGAWQPTYASGAAGSPGSVNMEVNRSVKYNNVNQGDWIVPKDTPKDKNYFVFDSHSECMSVSFIDFDPHPSIVANSCEVQTAELSQAEAISLHNEGLHLDGAGVNGHVYVQNVNYVHGNVTITAAVGNHLSDEGRYTSSYSLLLDGRELSSSLESGSGSYDIAFLPVSADCNLQIRGKYTNNYNGLTFHSRTSKASLTTHIELAAPAPVERDGQYVVNKNIANDGETYTYGVCVKEGLSFQIEGNTDRYYYADFNLADAEIVDSKHYLTKYNVCEGITEWVKNLDAEGTDWFENGQNNDWSSIMKDGKAMPLYLPAVATAADANELEAQTIVGEIKAVYPFLIDPEAKLVAVQSKAPNRAATSNGVDDITVDGKKLSYVPVPAEVRINVLADNVISGVANVAVDAVAEGDVEYYSISGVRVYGEPAPGIYLRRQGNTVSKVVIR